MKCSKLCLFVKLHLAFLLASCQAGPLAHLPKKYLAACLLARNGNQDIREWVEYHLAIGFDKIFLLDHNSTIPMFYEVADYVAEGRVHYTAFHSESPRPPKIRHFSEGLQGRAFQQCFDWGRGYFSWMAFTDLDEVLVVNDPKYNFSLPALLRRYEGHGAVLAHWVRLGSGGLEARKEGQGRLETFTQCTLPRGHVKGIANLKYASLGANAHMFNYHGGRRGIRPGDGYRVGGAHMLRNPLAHPLAVYHYSGALSEWRDRIKTLGAGVSGFSNKAAAHYKKVEEESTLPCGEAAAVSKGLMRRRPQPGCDAASLERIAALSRAVTDTAMPTPKPESRPRLGGGGDGRRRP